MKIKKKVTSYLLLVVLLFCMLSKHLLMLKMYHKLSGGRAETTRILIESQGLHLEIDCSRTSYRFLPKLTILLRVLLKSEHHLLL